MIKNKWIAGGLAALIILTIFYSLNTARPYPEVIKSDREAYQKNMLAMEDSPINATNHTAFSYFEPDENYAVTAEFEPAAQTAENYTILMTDSSSTEIPLAGIAHVTVQNQHVDLKVFDEGENYMLPFTDDSNGKTTYGGGRYLNIPKDNLKSGKIKIDFNQAHNFYCAYNYNYICPIPPPENRIPVAVNAGEKVYQQ